uniref:DNA-directed RNA polymerase subunit alpha n=1 Tax=Lygus hesperus TaxID=30085 RepID=A0A0A9YS32_LYGHE
MIGETMTTIPEDSEGCKSAGKSGEVPSTPNVQRFDPFAHICSSWQEQISQQHRCRLETTVEEAVPGTQLPETIVQALHWTMVQIQQRTYQPPVQNYRSRVEGAVPIQLAACEIEDWVPECETQSDDLALSIQDDATAPTPMQSSNDLGSWLVLQQFAPRCFPSVLRPTFYRTDAHYLRTFIVLQHRAQCRILCELGDSIDCDRRKQIPARARMLLPKYVPGTL